MNKIKDFATVKKPADMIRIIGVYLLVCILALLPVIAGFTGMFVEETITGRRAHEGNSIFGALPWLGLITIPLGLGLLLFWTIIVLKTNISLFKKHP